MRLIPLAEAAQWAVVGVWRGGLGVLAHHRYYDS